MRYRSVVLLLLLVSCYNMRPSKGGGQDVPVARVINPKDIALAPGYSISMVADSLNFPTAVAFDQQGRLHVIESGYSYGEVFTTPTLLRLEGNRKITVATGGKNGPWNGIDFHEGQFYIAEGGQLEGGRILRIDVSGNMTAIVSKLPGYGDHHTNGPVIRNGYLYFGQGTATNSGVVGPDNAQYGWLKRFPQFHDIPCQDIILAGTNYSTENPLSDTAGTKTVTGAYSPFGRPTSAGQVIPGQTPCTGAVLRVPLTGGETEWVAWGFRNPYGMAFAPDGSLYVTENGFDERGSRPVWGAGDVLWKVQQGFWYGWPDHSAGARVYGTDDYKPPKKDTIKRVLNQNPGTPPRPTAILGVHSSSNGFDFSRTDKFGFEGNAFVAQFGDMAPEVGKVLSPVGFKIVRVDPLTGIVRDFAVNSARRNGPASKLGSGGLERPISARFSPDGASLYIVDFGIMRMSEKGAEPIRNTGVIWKISRATL